MVARAGPEHDVLDRILRIERRPLCRKARHRIRKFIMKITATWRPEHTDSRNPGVRLDRRNQGRAGENLGRITRTVVSSKCPSLDLEVDVLPAGGVIGEGKRI